MTLKYKKTVADIMKREGVVPAPVSMLRPEHRASSKERQRANESLRKRCPYLFRDTNKLQ